MYGIVETVHKVYMHVIAFLSAAPFRRGCNTEQNHMKDLAIVLGLMPFLMQPRVELAALRL